MPVGEFQKDLHLREGVPLIVQQHLLTMLQRRLFYILAAMAMLKDS